jgi:hypothetical protein
LGGAETGDVEVAIGAEEEALRKGEPSRGDEGVDEGSGRAVIPQHPVGVVAGDVEVAIGAEGEAGWLRDRGGENVDEGSGRAVIPQHFGATSLGDVEVTIGAEGEAVRKVEPSRSRRDEGVGEGPCRAVVPQHLVGAVARDEQLLRLGRWRGKHREPYKQRAQ